MNTKLVRAAAFGAVMVPAAAYAHTGMHPTGGFSAGLSHPFLGLDHVLAMVLVGAWAGMQRRAAMLALPVAFLALMAVGAGAGLAGVALPAVELGIGLSVVVLGALAAANVQLLPVLGAAIVGVFALAHGHAHGAEVPAGASALTYGAGFLLGTAALHAIGIGVSRMARKPALHHAVRAGAGVAGLAGVAIVLGL